MFPRAHVGASVPLERQAAVTHGAGKRWGDQGAGVRENDKAGTPRI
jgi:hypothetical protein